MRKKREERNLEEQGRERQQPYSGIIREIDPSTGTHAAGSFVIRECGPAGMALRLDRLDYDEIVARQNLEQVGRILHRLDLDMAEILELRTETRAILAELAA